MEKTNLLLLLLLVACSANEEKISPLVKPSIVKVRHEFKTTSNGRDDSTFPSFSSGESAGVNESFYEYSGTPIVKQIDAIVISADWFDADINENLTFNVYVSAPTVTIVAPPDNEFVLVGTANGYDYGIDINLTTTYPFGDITNKSGQYIHTRFQWVDSASNVSLPIYDIKVIDFNSSVLSTGASDINGWLYNTSHVYTVTAFEEVHIDTTYNITGSTFLTPDTVFNSAFYVGNLTAKLTKTNPNIASVAYKTNLGYVSTMSDFTGMCCTNVGVNNSSLMYAVIKAKAQNTCSVHYKFDGIRFTMHE